MFNKPTSDSEILGKVERLTLENTLAYLSNETATKKKRLVTLTSTYAKFYLFNLKETTHFSDTCKKFNKFVFKNLSFKIKLDLIYFS